MSSLSEEIMALSNEYVLGLLSPSEEMLIEEIMARDAELDRWVGTLRDDLLPLDQSAKPQELPTNFADRIRDQLARQELPRTAAATPSVQPANLPTKPRQWGLGLAAASLVGLAVGFGAAGFQPSPQPVVVAVLLDAAGVPQAVIDDYGNDTATVRFVANITVPADRTLQVWTLPSQQQGPTSMGTLVGAAATRLSFQDLPAPHEQQLYEVTLEPLGGSPTGRPTGPIIGKGFAASQT